MSKEHETLCHHNPNYITLFEINWIRHYVISINMTELLIIRNVRRCLTSFGEEYASLSPCAAISLRIVPYTALNEISVSL